MLEALGCQLLTGDKLESLLFLFTHTSLLVRRFSGSSAVMLGIWKIAESSKAQTFFFSPFLSNYSREKRGGGPFDLKISFFSRVGA